MKTSLLARLAVVTFLLVPAGGCAVAADSDAAASADSEHAATTSEALSASSVLSFTAPAAIRQSTGNLYWTANAVSEFGGSFTAQVFRASKSSTPGSEVALHTETSATPVTFGAITWAHVNGTFFGYFVANYGSVSQIKRVPLGGGAATVMATSPSSIGLHQTLQTDANLDSPGSSLYWADATGIRSMPLAGGAVRTMATLSDITNLVLDSTSIYVARGARIFSIPKSGGTLVARVVTGSAVTSLDISPDQGYLESHSDLVWSERGGKVYSKDVYHDGSDAQSLLEFTAAPGFDVLSTTIFSPSTYTEGLAWTACTTPGNSTCYTYVKTRFDSTTPPSVIAGVGASFVQADATQVFWGTANDLRRSTL